MKATYLILTAALMTGTLRAEFRTWTRNDGKTADLELVGTSGEGASLKGNFKMKNGKSVSLAASDFSDADSKFVENWKPSEPVGGASDATASGGASVFDEMLDGNLLKLDGKSLKRYDLEKKPTKYYLFYYTASWCGPCQAFTPHLVKFYELLKPTSEEFEIVLITSDRDKDAMETYAKDKGMNWPHLKLSKVDRFEKKFKHPGSGIPNLVLTDLEGNLIKTSYEGETYRGPTAVMNHLAGLLAK